MPTKTKKVDVALRHGHLERISEAEYLEITGTAKKTANDVLEEKLSKMKTAKELLAFMTNEGYEAEDIEKVKALSKLPEMVAAIIEIDKNYN